MAKILVVEDSSFQRNSIVKSLEDMGFDVVGVEDGTIALEELVNKSYDLVITDLTMPDIDGLTLLGKLQNDFGHIPTLVITSREGSERECYDKGAREVIKKPYNKEDLQRIIGSILDR